jgi:hypothetical protein
MFKSTRVINGFGYDPDRDPHLHQEWLVTNGLGGYASGTIAGDLTRRYHGLLVAALPNPWGRYLMLTALSERCCLSGQEPIFLGSCELWGTVEHGSALMLVGSGLPSLEVSCGG